MSFRRAAFLICFQASLSIAAGAQTGSIRCGGLLDVRSGQIAKDQVVSFENGVITNVAAADSHRLSSGSEPIDLSQLTCLPGLIDAHTHLLNNPGDTGYSGLGISVPRAEIYGVRNAQRTLLAGFTTVRNVDAPGFGDVALRDGINVGDVLGPRILASGPALSITGGHNDQNLLAPEYHYSADGVANGIEGVIVKVRENIKYGADVIKVMAAGGVMSQGDDPRSEQYSIEEMRAIVETAHGLGRKVAAHAHGERGIRDAILAGADSVEHASYINVDDIKLMKERGTYLVPTLYLGDWLPDNYKGLRITDNMIDKAKQVIPAARANLSRALQEGVQVAFGTDAGVYPHGLNAREFAVLVRMGMSPLKAIQAATLNAADLLGWADKVGVLERNHYADIIAVAGDPLSDIRTLEDVKFVMKGGTVVRNNMR